jgi:hypothetical protein
VGSTKLLLKDIPGSNVQLYLDVYSKN